MDDINDLSTRMTDIWMKNGRARRPRGPETQLSVEGGREGGREGNPFWREDCWLPPRMCVPPQAHAMKNRKPN